MYIGDRMKLFLSMSVVSLGLGRAPGTNRFLETNPQFIQSQTSSLFGKDRFDSPKLAPNAVAMLLALGEPDPKEPLQDFSKIEEVKYPKDAEKDAVQLFDSYNKTIKMAKFVVKNPQQGVVGIEFNPKEKTKTVYVVSTNNDKKTNVELILHLEGHAMLSNATMEGNPPRLVKNTPQQTRYTLDPINKKVKFETVHFHVGQMSYVLITNEANWETGKFFPGKREKLNGFTPLEKGKVNAPPSE